MADQTQQNRLQAAPNLTWKYTIIQGSFWIAFSSIFAFAAVYLRDQGFSRQQVGLTMALGYLLAMILQPVVAMVADRSMAIRLKDLVLAIELALFLSVVLLTILPNQFLSMLGLFVMIEAMLLVLQPLLYSLCMEQINQGSAVNFGLARGIGSGLFALSSWVLGRVIVSFGARLLLMVCAAAVVLLMVFVALFPAGLRQIRQTAIPGPDHLLPATFFRNALRWREDYPGLLLMLVGLVLIMTNLNLFSNYQIHFIERIGGDSQTLGSATALAAVLEIPVMGLFSVFSRSLGARKLLRISTIFFMVKALATLLAADIGQYLFSQIFQAGAYALYLPASVFYINSIMARRDSVKGQAFLGMTFTLGGIIGSLAGGFLLEKTTPQTTLMVCLGITSVGAVLAYLGMEKHRNATIRQEL